MTFQHEDLSWIEPELRDMNTKGFCKDLEQLRVATYSSLSKEDFDHLRRTELVGKTATLVGFATAWMVPNPLSAFLMSIGITTRWLLAHHITHRGYDNVPGTPERYKSKTFARGWRRYIDWFDWILPQAWNYEHNVLHHYHTGENEDPDLLERYLEKFRAFPVPRFLKYLCMGLAALSWKYIYYAPNTMSTLDPESKKRLKTHSIAFISFMNIFQLNNPHVRKLWRHCYLPYIGFHFLLLPLAFSPLGQGAVISVFLTRLMAECFANLHSFLVIAPNHTADDLYRFWFHYDDKEEFYVTQVLGSVNYTCGKEWVDFMSVWLNYQIEHHLFPDLPMSKYREIQPKVKELCKKHHIPYRQESIWKRNRKLLDICVGKTSMKRLREFPRRIECVKQSFVTQEESFGMPQGM